MKVIKELFNKVKVKQGIPAEIEKRLIETEPNINNLAIFKDLYEKYGKNGNSEQFLAILFAKLARQDAQVTGQYSNLLSDVTKESSCKVIPQEALGSLISFLLASCDCDHQLSIANLLNELLTGCKENKQAFLNIMMETKQ